MLTFVMSEVEDAASDSGSVVMLERLLSGRLELRSIAPLCREVNMTCPSFNALTRTTSCSIRAPDSQWRIALSQIFRVMLSFKLYKGTGANANGQLGVPFSLFV